MALGSHMCKPYSDTNKNIGWASNAEPEPGRESSSGDEDSWESLLHLRCWDIFWESVGDHDILLGWSVGIWVFVVHCLRQF